MKLLYDIQGHGQVEIPTRWESVTIERFTDWLNFVHIHKDDEEITGPDILSGRTGIPVEIIRALPGGVVLQWMQLTQFMEDFEALSSYNRVLMELVEKTDVGQLSWEKLEECRIHIKNELDAGRVPFGAAKEILRVYLDMDVTGQPITEVYGLAAFFLSRLTSFFKSSADLLTITHPLNRSRQESPDLNGSATSTH